MQKCKYVKREPKDIDFAFAFLLQFRKM